MAAFASVAAYRGEVALGGDFPHLLDALFATGKPVALIAMGNPYLVRSFPKAAAFLLTFSTVPPSETAAVQALLRGVRHPRAYAGDHPRGGENR